MPKAKAVRAIIRPMLVSRIALQKVPIVLTKLQLLLIQVCPVVLTV